MTIDDLVAMMNREFERTRSEIKVEFKTEIDRLDRRMARFEYQLEEVKDMIKHLEEVDILIIQKRVTYLEQELRRLKKTTSR